LSAESGLTAPVDPVGGSYYVEALTDELVARIDAELAEIERRGGTLAALAEGYQQGAIAQAAYEEQRAIEAGERIGVGVNAYLEEGDEQRPEPQPIDVETERRQVERTRATRDSRDAAAVQAALADLEAAATGTENVLPHMRTCVEADVTLGEISGLLRRCWGEYRP
jgi:methylmalonyl-CoA mutase N-terminal domain/subunit